MLQNADLGDPPFTEFKLSPAGLYVNDGKQSNGSTAETGSFVKIRRQEGK